MRKGQNPARHHIPAYSPHRLGMGVLLYIPHQDGYFEEAFEIFKIQIASLRQHTGEAFDLLVFDNGSCNEVQQGLQELQIAGWIDWLILSRHNMGKTGALNWMLAAMPNEIIGYADSDVFFRPGWFLASMDILEAFPSASIVTAQPNFFDVFKGEGKAHLQLSPEEYEHSEFKPSPQDVDEYCLGIGASDELTKKYHEMVFTAYYQRSSGIMALLNANHMQFIGRRDVLRKVLPLPATLGLSPDEDKQFDYRLNQAGYVHLSTARAYVYHIGNSIDDHIRPELKSLDMQGVPLTLEPGESMSEAGNGLGQFVQNWIGALARSRMFGRFFLKLYRVLFKVFSERI